MTAYPPQHFLNFFPDPHGHGSLRPVFARTGCGRGWLRGGRNSVTLPRYSWSVGERKKSHPSLPGLVVRAHLVGPDFAGQQDEVLRVLLDELRRVNCDADDGFQVREICSSLHRTRSPESSASFPGSQAPRASPRQPSSCGNRYALSS